VFYIHEPGEKWEKELPADFNLSPSVNRIIIELYKDKDDVPYRTLFLSVKDAETSNSIDRGKIDFWARIEGRK
jgi:hypothetical protein